MSSQSPPRRLGRPLVRSGVVVLAVAASTGFGLASAGAAPTSAVVLDPAYVEVGTAPIENLSAREVAFPVAPEMFHDVLVGWGATVRISVPPQLVATAPTAELELSAADGVPTTTYDSSDPGSPLTIADLGGNLYEVHLPADDGVNGPVGGLRLLGFSERSGADVTLLDPAYFTLSFDAAGPATLDLSQQFTAESWACDDPSVTDCASVATAPAGGSFTVTLPASSRFAVLGIPDLGTSAMGLQVHDPSGQPAQTPVVPTTVTPTADPRTVSLGVPANTPPGSYDLTVVMGDGTDRFVATATAHVDVVAAPAPTSAAPTSAAPSASAAPALNQGLESETGWEQHTAGHGSAAPLAIGAAALLGVGGAVVLRARRRARS